MGEQIALAQFRGAPGVLARAAGRTHLSGERTHRRVLSPSTKLRLKSLHRAPRRAASAASVLLQKRRIREACPTTRSCPRAPCRVALSMLLTAMKAGNSRPAHPHRK